MGSHDHVSRGVRQDGQCLRCENEPGCPKTLKRRPVRRPPRQTLARHDLPAQPRNLQTLCCSRPFRLGHREGSIWADPPHDFEDNQCSAARIADDHIKVARLLTALSGGP